MITPIEVPVCDHYSTTSLGHCSHCSLTFVKRNEFVNHMQRWHSTERFLCGRGGCTETFSSSATCNLHRLRRHAANPRAFACTECRFACAMRADLNQHLRRRHPQIAPPLQQRGVRRAQPGVLITPLDVTVKRRAAAAVVSDKKSRKRRTRTEDSIDHINPTTTFPLVNHEVDWSNVLGDNHSADGSADMGELEPFDPIKRVYCCCHTSFCECIHFSDIFQFIAACIIIHFSWRHQRHIPSLLMRNATRMTAK